MLKVIKYAALPGVLAAMALLAGCGGPLLVTVPTYHYDNYRSGWDQNEASLTYARVGSSSFGELFNIPLDDQVDAQPLIVPIVNVTVGSSRGVRNVAYVATENNTIYMIDNVAGTILHSKNFGPPVPAPLGCTNNGPNVGINGTPVIDAKTMTMYVVTYTLESGTPVYRLRALDPGSLAEKIPSVVVSASHILKDGTTHFAFDAKYQRQRAALVEANGNIYAGFGSFCDWGGGHSRGWVLGWNAATLAPLAANQMNDTQVTEPNNMFLSSVWMSGYGIAADDAGHLYFVTGNSDYSGTTYDGVTNIQESVVKESADLTKVLSLFTPSGPLVASPSCVDSAPNRPVDQSDLEKTDCDYGSGGVLLVPKQPSDKASMGAAAGKNGKMYVLDLANLGGKTVSGIGGTPVDIGGCWCGQSYFSDGTVHVVASGGNSVTLWKVQASPLALTQEATSGGVGGNQDPGFFTSISSNGTGSSSEPIIWAVSRQDTFTTPPTPGPVYLTAFKGKASGGTLPQLFHAQAGTWLTLQNQGNANIVPVVANGRVLVASHKQLRIFGLH